MDLQLRGRTALVTGASTGIGRSIAIALAAEGVRVAISARRLPLLMEVANQIEASGGPRPIVIESDLYAEDAAQQLTSAAIAGLGQVDILVNNAGGSRSFTDLHVSEERWQEAMTLNFHRPRQVADALLDQMIAHKWGRIINITGKSEPEHVNGAFCAKATAKPPQPLPTSSSVSADSSSNLRASESTFSACKSSRLSNVRPNGSSPAEYCTKPSSRKPTGPV